MRRQKFITILIVLLAVCSFAHIGYSRYYATPPGLIRLHVIANSNTFYDQQLKYQVKDRIVMETRDQFSKAKSIQEARRIADNSANTIELAALDEIRNQGFNYPVKVVRGNFQFPEKTYAVQNELGQVTQLTLPPGKYEAVRVIIGDGQGANWWCVLYPPLCFVDMAKTTPSASLTAAAAVKKQNTVNNTRSSDKSKVEYRIKALDIFRTVFK